MASSLMTITIESSQESQHLLARCQLPRYVVWFNCLANIKLINIHSMVPRAGFKYVFVYQILTSVFVFELKITKGCIFVFHIWSVFEKYLQIQ